MRSGLQNPGAIPLLAVFVAGLLSITPNLCEAQAKPEDAPGIGHSGESNNSMPTIHQHVPSPSIIDSGGSDSDPCLINAFNNIENLRQQVCHIATTFILSSSTSSKQQDAYTLHAHARGHSRDDLDEILNSQRQRNFYDGINNNNNNSVKTQPIMDSTSITISLASLPNMAADKNSNASASSSSSSSPSTSSIQYPSTPQSEDALVNASNSVDRKGSYMAILVSLIVAIFWF